MPRSATLPTKPSTRRLSEVARHLVIPEGIVTTGWPAVAAKCAEFGDEFDEWQHGVGRVVLGKRADGLYAATVGGITLSIPRQVAKTFLVGRIVVALCILFPGLTVLWTAHHNRTLTRTFRSMQAFVKRKKVAPYLAQTANNGIRTANGEQEILFANGSIIMFGAREQGFGRGFEEVDVEVFDEAQILTEKALEDMVAATNQSRHPHGALLFYMGTPPRPTDPGEAFTIRRTKALAGKSKHAVYIECSADEDADPDDRAQWAKANASYPHRTPLASMLRLRENLPSDDSWRREALGIWDSNAGLVVIPPRAWAACLDTDSQITSPPVFALDVSPLRNWAAIAVAGANEAGRIHVEVTSRNGVVDHRPETDWVVPRLAELKAVFPSMTVAIAAGQGAEGLKLDIEAVGIPVDLVSPRDVAAGCGMVYDYATTQKLAHLGQPALDSALKLAKKRIEDGENAWVWGRRRSSGDITPVYAVTLALRAAVLALNDSKHPINNIW